MRAAMDALKSLDIQILFFLQSLRHPWLDIVFAILTELGSYLFAFSIGLVFLLFPSHARKKAAAEIWLGTFLSFSVTMVLKHFFAVLRPYRVLDIQLVVASEGYALPSGHSSMAFAAACVLSANFPSCRYLWYALAFAVAISRVYLGVHYPSDCVLGGLIGWLIGRFAVKLLSDIRKNSDPMPKTKVRSRS